jgi:hypothetical protein
MKNYELSLEVLRNFAINKNPNLIKMNYNSSLNNSSISH